MGGRQETAPAIPISRYRGQRETYYAASHREKKLDDFCLDRVKNNLAVSRRDCSFSCSFVI